MKALGVIAFLLSLLTPALPLSPDRPGAESARCADFCSCHTGTGICCCVALPATPGVPLPLDRPTAPGRDLAPEAIWTAGAPLREPVSRKTKPGFRFADRGALARPRVGLSVFFRSILI